MDLFKGVKNWLARWTWKKAWKKVYPVVMKALKDLVMSELKELEELLRQDSEIAKAETLKKISEIKAKLK